VYSNSARKSNQTTVAVLFICYVVWIWFLQLSRRFEFGSFSMFVSAVVSLQGVGHGQVQYNCITWYTLDLYRFLYGIVL